MKQLKNSSKPRNNRGVHEAAVPVLDEILFKRMLSLERRRSERTLVPFALVLLDMEDLIDVVRGPVIDGVASRLATAMRETDITGWYKDSSTIGIILTTLNGTDRNTLYSVIVKKIKSILSLDLGADQIRCVRISCHVFPQEDAAEGFERKPDRKFLSDREKDDFKPGYSAGAKKAIDVMGSLAALVVLSPVFAVIALLVRFTSPGPIFFRQKRVGQFGEPFTFLKFRSMYVNSDPAIHQEYIRQHIDKKVVEAGGTFKMTNDPRITSIGRFLRRSSLDELPQFVNVLRGDMSLVGPRPAIPYELERYSLWHRRRILEAKPGITGPWQVYGRSRTTFDEMVRMDLRYIRNQSLWLDLKILLKTPFAVFSGHGAC